MKNNNFAYYITIIIIWIILVLGIYYLYTNISSTLYWNAQVKNIYEQFYNVQNHWSPTKGELDRNKDNYWECTYSLMDDRKGYTLGCKWGKIN